MADKQKLKPLKGEEELALHIAEQSDLSLNQAKELIQKHGNNLKKIEEAAKIYKAEG
ncbi:MULTISPECIES: hypothetical protein [Mesorhizobium]|uniref:hypothetical protein n=1 Tax=Mesorhizobium TaxID=68287 RepID=UPI001484DAD8|nr:MULTISPECIES: hypothetical protein [Mesorhizobium]